MAKIDVSQFLGKPKEYDILGQRVVLEPLKGKDLDLLVGMKEGKEAEGIKRLITKSFGITDEEFDELPLSFVNKAAEAVMDVNGLSKKE